MVTIWLFVLFDKMWLAAMWQLFSSLQCCCRKSGSFILVIIKWRPMSILPFFPIKITAHISHLVFQKKHDPTSIKTASASTLRWTLAGSWAVCSNATTTSCTSTAATTAPSAKGNTHHRTASCWLQWSWSTRKCSIFDKTWQRLVRYLFFCCFSFGEFFMFDDVWCV